MASIMLQSADLINRARVADERRNVALPIPRSTASACIVHRSAEQRRHLPLMVDAHTEPGPVQTYRQRIRRLTVLLARSRPGPGWGRSWTAEAWGSVAVNGRTHGLPCCVLAPPAEAAFRRAQIGLLVRASGRGAHPQPRGQALGSEASSLDTCASAHSGQAWVRPG